MDKLVLVQDDWAPDAMNTFKEQFLKLTGISFNDFLSTADIKGDDCWSTYYGDKYIVTISADKPYYYVYKM